MKERANGYKFKSCDEETAINVVVAQIESERQVPFSTEQAHLDMANLPGKAPVSDEQEN